jgi:hypothetical protein
VYLWRFIPRRSLRRAATRRLNAGRTVAGWPWVQIRAAAWLRASDWGEALGVALVLSLPLAALLGRDVGSWLDGAWQISAVLIGLVVALIIFLLQAAGAQSLRAESTYRALLASTGLVWPVAFALVFLAWVAALERFADRGSATAAWAETYALVFFTLQVVAFGAVFVQLLKLVSPQGALRVVKTAFADAVRASVREKLIRRHAEQLFNDDAKRFEVDYSYLGQGGYVSPGRTGWVDDIDRRLPKTIAEHGFAKVATVTATLGHRATAESTIARINGPVTAWRTRAIRRGIRVRRSQRAAGQPMEVFIEALDVARRAADERERSALTQGIDLLASCTEELPRAYRLYGQPYINAVVSEGILPSTEDDLARELQRFSRDVLSLGRIDAAQELPGLSFRLVLAGVQQDAPLLVTQALRLWLTQVFIARDIESRDVATAVNERVASLARDLVRNFAYELEDDALPLKDRLVAVGPLTELFRFEVELMKAHGDAGDVHAFKRVWKELAEWGRHSEPDHEADELNFQLSIATEPSQRRALTSDLERARALVRAHETLKAARSWGLFQLGAWLLHRYRGGALNDEQWREMSSYLTGVFGSADELTRHLPRFWDADERLLSQLHDWEWDTVEPDDGFVRLDFTDLAVFWAVLMLLAMTAPEGPPAFSFEKSITHTATELRKRVDAIEAEREKWDKFVGGRLDEKANQLRKALDEAVQADAEAQRRLVAAAPISEDAVKDFAEEQQRAFARAARLRPVLLHAGVLSVEDKQDAFAGRVGWLTPKRLWVEHESRPRLIGGNQPGRRAALEEERWIADAMAAFSEQANTKAAPVDAAISCIAELRERGLTPDAVVVPERVWIRPLLARHPNFLWASDDSALGHLDGVPVYAAAPRDADYLLVADVGAAVRIIEHRRPGMANGLRVAVTAIDAARAEVLLDSGRVKWDERKTPRDEAIRVLVEEHAEIFVDMDYRIEKGSRGSEAVFYVSLGPETKQRPMAL